MGVESNWERQEEERGYEIVCMCVCVGGGGGGGGGGGA